jgi:hypothetical protein
MYDVVLVGPTGEVLADRLDPQDLARKLTEFATRFVEGLGSLPIQAQDMELDQAEVGLAVTAEGKIAVVAASATASLTLRFSRAR